MPSASNHHTCLLCDDGRVVAFGWNGTSCCNIPALHEGLTYAQVVAAGLFTFLLRSDGAALVSGGVGWGGCGTDRMVIPQNRRGVTYTQAAAGHHHWVLLRSDGTAVAGTSSRLQCGELDIPVLSDGSSYVQVAAGAGHTVLLTSRGKAIAMGQNQCDQCNIPELKEGTVYTYIAAGVFSTGLVRSDGKVIICTRRRPFQQENLVPALEEGVSYVEIAIGYEHIVLLRSDGLATAAGSNHFGQCRIPVLEDGVVYTQVAAMSYGTVLLRSDGRMVHVGDVDHEHASEEDRQCWANCSLPPAGRCYKPIPRKPQVRLLQLWCRLVPGGLMEGGLFAEAVVRNLAGDVLMEGRVDDWQAKVLEDLYAMLPTCCQLVIILPDASRMNPKWPWYRLLVD